PVHEVSVMKSWQESAPELMIQPPSRSDRPISTAFSGVAAGGGVAAPGAPNGSVEAICEPSCIVAAPVPWSGGNWVVWTGRVGAGSVAGWGGGTDAERSPPKPGTPIAPMAPQPPRPRRR